MEYFILTALLIIWCIIHSAMISLTVADYLKDRLGSCFRFYRLFYNGVALTTLIPVIIYCGAIKGDVLFRFEGYMAALQLLLLITGVLLFIAGGRRYDMLQLLGIRQIKTGVLHGAISRTGGIYSSGVLGITRHPWYLAAMMIIWSGFREMYVSTLILNIIFTIYLIIGTLLEEKKLILECGDEYIKYQKNVSMLIPFKWFLSKFKNYG